MYTQINEPKNAFCPSIKEKQGLTCIASTISQMSFPLTRFTLVSAQEATVTIKAALVNRFGQELFDQVCVTTNVVDTHVNGTTPAYILPQPAALVVNQHTPLIAVNVRGRVLGQALNACVGWHEYLEFNDRRSWAESNAIHRFGKNIFFVEEIEGLLNHLGYVFIEQIRETENKEAGEEAP